MMMDFKRSVPGSIYRLTSDEIRKYLPNIQSGSKKMASILYALTLSNISRFSTLFYYFTLGENL